MPLVSAHDSGSLMSQSYPGGHNGLVTVALDLQHGRFVTGGEDGKVCLWGGTGAKGSQRRTINISTSIAIASNLAGMASNNQHFYPESE